MPSQLQIEANRRNSQKSTGPRTTAGKAVSSHNALGSGIYAESETIRDENASDLEALAASYYDRFHPDAPEQRAFVDVLIHSEWTLRRLRRSEAQLWEQNMEWSEPCSAENLFPLGRALNYDASKVFARLQHRITATQRNYERALKDLQRLGPQPPAGRPIPKREPVSAPAPPTQIGFVSSPVAPPPAASAARPKTNPLRTLPIMEACPSALSPASPC
jgi:hypothetical protein